MRPLQPLLRKWPRILRLRSALRRDRSRSETASPPTDPGDPFFLDGPAAGSAFEAAGWASPAGPGVHLITRATDIWFDIEVAKIEKRALEEARRWAQAGLPRHDAPATEALPVETALGKLCCDVFRRWAQRVRTKVEDAIEEANQHVGAKLLVLRFHLTQLERTVDDIRAAERESVRIRSETVVRETSFGHRSFLHRWHYFMLLGALVVVDWIANVPIFHELVPQEPGADQAWRDLVARAERYGLLAGLYRVWARVLFAPDVSLLALGIIVFLLFLGHVLGGSLRRIIAVREEDAPDARLSIQSHRRQFPLPALVSGVGITLVLTVLFLSRNQVERVTRDRLERAAAEVAALEEELTRAKAASEIEAIARVETRLPEARSALEERSKRAAYAAGITAMNIPILLLNIVLVLAAALAAYLANRETVTDGRAVDPRQIQLQTELARLRAEAREHRDALRDLGAEVQQELAKASYLLGARPLRDWEGKAERLRRVIPLFRAENARERRIDPANIWAFQRPVPLELPPMEADEPFAAPVELARHREEFDRLRSEQLELERSLRARPPEGGEA